MKKLMLSTIALCFMLVIVSCSNNETASTENQTVTKSAEPIAENVEESETDELTLTQETEEEIPVDEKENSTIEESKTAPEKPTPKSPTKPTKKPKDVIKESPNPKPTKSDGSTTSEKPPKPLPETKKPEKPAEPKRKVPGKPSHDAFNSLLSSYVSSTGSVNYAGFKSKENELGKYLRLLSENPVQNDWTRNEKMAYWINLYNAGTIKLILANYPTSSIQNIAGGKPWDKRFIKSGGKSYTLNEIENSILRPQFKDARIHFAVNCAAVSCPRLMNQAFTSANLNSLLEQNAKWFINNPTFNDISSKKVEVSKIFDWYGGDFGNLIEYLNKYSTTPIKANAKVEYKEYNWNLNGK